MAKYITAWRVSPFNSRVVPVCGMNYREPYTGQSESKIEDIVRSWHDEDNSIIGYSIENVGPGGSGSDGRFVEVIQ